MKRRLGAGGGTSPNGDRTLGRNKLGRSGDGLLFGPLRNVTESNLSRRVKPTLQECAVRIGGQWAPWRDQWIGLGAGGGGSERAGGPPDPHTAHGGGVMVVRIPGERESDNPLTLPPPRPPKSTNLWWSTRAGGSRRLLAPPPPAGVFCVQLQNRGQFFGRTKE